jgi:hypothetical protein
MIVRVIFISSFLFYCLLLNHSFQTNPNKITNCFQFILSIYNFTNYICSMRSSILIFEQLTYHRVLRLNQLVRLNPVEDVPSTVVARWGAPTTRLKSRGRATAASKL